MDKKDWRQIAMGTVVAIAGVVGLTSCENTKENQDDNKKAKTEQNDYKIGREVLNDVKYPTVKSANKEGEQDSILTGVDAKSVRDHVLRMNKFEYTNPTYEVKGKKDSRKVKVDIARQGDDMITETGKPEYKIKFSYDERTPEDSIREAQERIEAQKEKEMLRELWHEAIDNMSTGLIYGFDGPVDNPKVLKNKLEEMRKRINPEYTLRHVGVPYKDEFDIVHFDYVTPNSTRDNSKKQVEEQVEEQVSAKQDRPEKKEPPKGSINKDAFINALLEEKRGGRGGKKS